MAVITVAEAMQHLGIDYADEVTHHIEERTARVSGIDSRVVLKQCHRNTVDAHVSVKRTDYSVGDGSAERAERISDSDDILTNDKL